MSPATRRLRTALAPALLALAGSGCIATQQDMLNLSQQNDTIQLQVQQLKKVMTDIQANQADLNARLDDMRQQMSTLNGNLQDNQDSTGRLSAKMDDLGAALGMKVSSLQKGIAQTQESIAQEEARHRAETAAAAQREADAQARLKAQTAATAAAEEAAKPSAVFQQARAQFDQRSYEMAAQGFQLYLDQYPKGETADLAGYYLGQSRYAQRKWEQAARAYALVLDRYPKSDVTPAARLRYAESLLRLGGHDAEAKSYLESIPQDFKSSPEAVKAHEILRLLEKKKRK